MTDNNPERTNRRACIWLPRPFVFIVLAYIMGMIVFSGMRLVFFLIGKETSLTLDIWSVCKAFLIGLRFDQVVVLALLLPLLLILPWIKLRWRMVRIATVGYLAIVLSACILLLLADSRFYLYFGSHLNFQAFVYFNQGDTFWHLIYSEPMFYPMVFGWIIVTALLVFVFVRLYNRTRSLPDRRSWPWQVLLFVVFAALVMLGIRGRVGTAPIKWGLAYFSQDHFINQLGLNGIYTLAKAYSEEGHDSRLSYLDESERFPFADFHLTLDSVRAILNQESDQWLEPDSSLLRITQQPDALYGFKPNIMIVLMESWCGRHTSALGAPHNLTPKFDRLADDGLLFTNFFASGTRTSYGITATMGSFPALPGRSVMTRYNANHPFVFLSEILHERGYANGFVYGGDLMFDNMQGFLTTKRFQRFVGEDDFDNEDMFAKWGVPDHIVFDRVVNLTDSIPRPFQMTVLTLSNHEPFDLPDSSHQRFIDNSDSSRIFNAHLYADFALGRFMENMKNKPVFDSTIFLFVSDHNTWGGRRAMIDPVNFQIPLLIYAPNLLGDSGRRISTVGGQVDILPTLMGLLGSDYTHASWGRDLLNLPDDDSGFAMINVLNWTGLVEHGLVYEEHVAPYRQRLLDFGDKSIPLHDLRDTLPAIYSDMQRRLHIFMQIAEQLSTPVTE